MAEERCSLLSNDCCKDESKSNQDKCYEKKKYEGRKARAALLTALLLMLPALFLLGRPYPRLAPSIWNPQMHSHEILVTTNEPPKYLVWSPQCQILSINPFSKESLMLFRRRSYISCSTGPQYVYKGTMETNQGVLYFNKTASKKDDVTCCYKSIVRKNASSGIVKSSCSNFNEFVVLSDTEEFIEIECSVGSQSRKLKYHKEKHKMYKDVFMNVHPSEEVKKRLDLGKKNYKKPYWNILIIGVDTLSRINLERAMPLTHQFFKTNHWLDFQGYNKIDDNTFPNLMAILTGRNSSRAKELCDGEGNNTLDNCDFMWKRFQKAGYVTAYAEDDIGIDTFEKPYHKGFVHKPTDHYLRPLFVEAEKSVSKQKGSVFCTGQKTSGEVLFQYALEFIEAYKNDPYFGFFWANTFSHNDVGTPSTMDEKVAEFLEKIKIFDKTFVIFISDHGIRFGNMRSTMSGYYEERLPAFFMYVPDKFKEMHKTAYSNLVANTGHLTTPYDVYMTLQDVLFISGREEVIISSEACPMCQSLFQMVPWNRSCDDCAITSHWCTCNSLKPLSRVHHEGNLAIHYIIDVVIEAAIKPVNTKKCRKCSKLTLHKVINIYTYDYLNNPNNITNYLVVFSTNPGNMIYEATVNHDSENNVFTQLGIVSRLSMYTGTGSCVKTAYLKKYCHCTKKCK